MRIVFDFNPIVMNRYSGLYAYGVGLLRGLGGLENRPEFVLFHSERFAKQVQSETEQAGGWAETAPTRLKMRWLEKFWYYSSFPTLQFFTGDFDIYHSSHHLMPPTKHKPRLLTVYDLRRYRLPHLYPGSKLHYFERAVRKADHFVAISQATKDDLCEFFDVPQERVDVVHLAANTECGPLRAQDKQRLKTELSQRHGVTLGRYLLVFSSPDRRKNVARTIEAFLSAQERLGTEYKLVVVGKPPKNDQAYKAVVARHGLERVVIAGAVENLGGLLQCADALVFASLYEGFGVPILEAFSCGVPVITSNCSSMPEVAGEAALYVNPYNSESIAEAMVRMCTDEQLRRKLVDSALLRSKEFSWTKTARETLQVYQKLL